MPTEQDTLTNLACLYLTLEFGTDTELPPERVARLGKRLSRWSKNGEARPIDALDRARTRLRAPGARVSLLHAVQNVRAAFGDNELAEILEDLIDVALHDDHYRADEARFVNALAKSWDVRGSIQSDVAHRFWSVLGEQAIEQRWTSVHDLALLYLALAHESDEEITIEEKDAITRKLGEWLPAALPEDVLNVVNDALKVYAGGPDPSLLSQAMESVREAVPEHQRRAVLADLMYVARADSIVLVEERAIIDRLARSWNLQMDGSTTGP